MFVVVLAVSLVVVGPVTGVVVGGFDSVGQSGNQLQQATPTPTNDTTRHEDPDQIDQNGDLADVRRWLAGRMAIQLERCAVEIGRDTTDVCEFRDQYPDWLSKYVDMAEETGTDEDDRQAETFEEAAEETQSLANQTDEFQETRREYEAAREAGNQTEARRLARELIRLGNDINRTASGLDSAYQSFERESGVDLSEGRESVNRTATNATEVVRTVESELFVATNLSAELSSREISFIESATVLGRLVTENGSPVANRTIVLRIGERSVTTVTSETGAFSVEYRPVALPLDTDALDVRYLPRNESVYLGSGSSVPVSVSQVEPSVETSVEPTTVRYGDELRVTGRVSVGDIGTEGLPVVVSVDGRQVGRVQTDSSGRFSLTAAISAADGPGEVAVRALQPLSGRAVARGSADATLSVRSTDSVLVLDAAAEGPAEANVSGVLLTADGDPVPNQPVTLRVNGTTVETVRTGPDGRFRASVAMPSSALEPGRETAVTIAGVYDASDTNLRRSAADTVVQLPPGPESPGLIARWVRELFGDLSATLVSIAQTLGLWLVVLSGLGVVVLGYLLWRFELISGVFAGEPDEPPGSEGVETGGPEPVGEPALVTQPLERARERLSSSADEAVMVAYGAVRAALSDSVRAAHRDADTHWEFLAACRQDGLDQSAIDSLVRLTEAYERAAYAPVSVDRTNAESVLDAAEPLIGVAD